MTVSLPVNTAPAELARIHLLCAVRLASDRGISEATLLAQINTVRVWTEIHPDGRGLTMEPSSEMLDLIRTLASGA